MECVKFNGGCKIMPSLHSHAYCVIAALPSMRPWESTASAVANNNCVSSENWPFSKRPRGLGEKSSARQAARYKALGGKPRKANPRASPMAKPRRHPRKRSSSVVSAGTASGIMASFSEFFRVFRSFCRGLAEALRQGVLFGWLKICYAFATQV